MQPCVDDNRHQLPSQFTLPLPPSSSTGSPWTNLCATPQRVSNAVQSSWIAISSGCSPGSRSVVCASSSGKLCLFSFVWAVAQAFSSYHKYCFKKKVYMLDADSTWLRNTRSVYRTIELSNGWDGRIIHTQVYFSTFYSSPSAYLFSLTHKPFRNPCPHPWSW